MPTGFETDCHHPESKESCRYYYGTQVPRLTSKDCYHLDKLEQHSCTVPRPPRRKKLQPRAQMAHFIGVESDERLIRVFVPTEKSIKLVRRVDFRPITEKPPVVSALLDGLAREHAIEVEEDDTQNAEAHLIRCMNALHQENPELALPQVHSVTLSAVPRTFAEACQSHEWAEAVDRECDTLSAEALGARSNVSQT